MHSAAGLCPDPLGELTALPQTLSSIKGGDRGAGDENEREVERREPHEAEKREIKGKGGELGIMEYVPILWKCVIGNHNRLAP